VSINNLTDEQLAAIRVRLAEITAARQRLQTVDDVLAGEQRWLQSQLPEHQSRVVQTGVKAVE